MGEESIQDPLIKVQESLLAYGPSYAFTSKHPPYWEYKTVVELVHLKHEPNEVEELTPDIKGDAQMFLHP